MPKSYEVNYKFFTQSRNVVRCIRICLTESVFFWVELQNCLRVSKKLWSCLKISPTMSINFWGELQIFLPVPITLWGEIQTSFPVSKTFWDELQFWFTASTFCWGELQSCLTVSKKTLRLNRIFLTVSDTLFWWITTLSHSVGNFFKVNYKVVWKC